MKNCESSKQMKHLRRFELRPHAGGLAWALSVTLVPSLGVLSRDELLIEFRSTTYMLLLDLQYLLSYNSPLHV